MGKVNRILLTLPLIATLLARPVLATEFVITDNGTGSTSEINTTAESTNTVTQTNEAVVTNNITTSANTGENTANGNEGDVAITTGNIEENVQVTNAMNTATSTTPCCSSDISATISGNGEDSVNNLTLNSQPSTVVNINNYANIGNSISGGGNTGSNTANNNTGSVTISTGSITAISKTVNSPINSYMANVGTGGVNLSVIIEENGSNSTNTIEYNSYGGTSVNANNVFVLSNIIGWNLDTGNNFANGNVGDVSIKTGNIVLDILIENLGNVGYVEATCCNDPDDPGDPSDPGDPTPSPSPTPTTSSTSTTGITSSTGGGTGPGILGLSATGGLPFNLLMLVIGFGMLLASYRLCKNYSLELQFYY